MKSRLPLYLTGLALLLLVGCGSAGQDFSPGSLASDGDPQSVKKVEGDNVEHQEGSRLLIFASIYPLYDFAQKIGGERVEVHMIVPPGAEAHDFEPTPAQLIELHRADLLIYNGLGMEMWVDRLLEALNHSEMVIVDSSVGIEQFKGTSDHHDADGQSHSSFQAKDKVKEKVQNEVDPHIWLDPIRAKQQAQVIRQALVERDPDYASYYNKNFERLSRAFDALHARFEAMSNQAERRDFVVSHHAFGYLAARYGLEQVAISGLSPSPEPGPKRMEEIVRLVREKELEYILVDKNVSNNVVKVIQEETGAKILPLYTLETLSEEEIAEGHDYFTIMEQNLKALSKALGAREQ